MPSLTEDQTLIQTIGEAYNWIRLHILPKNVTLLTESGMNSSESVNKDKQSSLHSMRKAIYTFLPPQSRRRLFFELASTPQGLLRLRTCFGAPPYAFLHPSDIYALNAGAIGVRRTHLAYNYGSNIPPFGQIGRVLEDEHANAYFMLPQTNMEHDQHSLPLVYAIEQGSLKHVTLQVSLQPNSIIRRQALVLTESNYHRNLRKSKENVTLHFKILSLHTSATRKRTLVLMASLQHVEFHQQTATAKRQKTTFSTPTESPNASNRSDLQSNLQSNLQSDVPPTPEFVTNPVS